MTRNSKTFGKTLSSLAAALLVFGLAACSEDPPAEQGAAPPEAGAPAAEASPLELLWSAETGQAVNVNPVVVGGQVLVIPRGGPLIALDQTTGMVNWKYEPEEGVWGRGLSTDGTQAYVCVKGGILAALNVADGSEIWRADLGVDCQRRAFAEDGVLYVPTTLVGEGLPGDVLSGAKLFSINAADGSVNWSKETKTYFLQTPFKKGNALYVGGNYNDPAINVLEGGLIQIFSLNAETGEENWVFESEDGTPKALYATDTEFVFIGYRDFVVNLDVATGKEKWRKDTGNWVPSLSGYGNTVFYGSATTYVHAWDMATGEERWRYNMIGRAFDYMMRSPIYEGDRLYFMSQQGAVYALKWESGAEDWVQQVDMDSRGMSVDNGVLYISDSKGRVAAYKIAR